MADLPPMPPGAGARRPHRGVLILVFGILGLVVCAPFGIAAWLMGNGDLRAMDTGEMDPEGRQLTLVGKVLGIVATVLLAIGILLSILWILFAFVLAAGAAASGAVLV